MNFSLVLLISICIAILSGCASATKMMIAGVGDRSKYIPFFIESSDVDEYKKTVTSVSGQVVKDDYGTHFVSISGDEVSGASLRKDDEAVLSVLFSGSVGLMEPIFTYDKNAIVVPDWSATERRYNFLTNDLKIKLLPLTATKQYATLINGYTTRVVMKQNGAASVFDKSFSGNYDLYNNEFSKNILSRIDGNFEYLLLNPLTKAYAFEQMQGDGNSEQYNRFKIATNSFKGAQNQYIQFVPKSYFDQLSKGASFRFYSACYGMNLTEMKTLYDVGVAKSVAAYPKSASEFDSAILLERNNLKRELADAEDHRQKGERGCKNALRALQISGNIKSQSLK